MKRKIEYIEQNEHSECGLACVTMMLRYVGKKAALSDLRDSFGVPNGGNNILHLKTIFNDYGVSTAAFRVDSIDKLEKFKQPFICYWEEKHFIIVEKIRKNNVYIVDPAFGKTKISRIDFEKKYSNIVLTIKNITENKSSELITKRESIYNLLGAQVKSNKFKYFNLFILTLLMQFATLCFPIVTQRLIDSSTKNIDFKFVGLLVGMSVLVYFIFQLSRSLILLHIQKDFSLTITRFFVEKLTKLPISFFINRTTGDIVYKYNLINYIQQVLTQQLLKTVIDIIFVSLYLYVMISYSLQLAIITLVVTGVIIAVSAINTIKFTKVNITEMSVQSRVQSKLVELIEGIETIKSMSIEKDIFYKWNEDFKESTEINFNKYKLSSWLTSFTSSIQVMLPFILIIVGLNLLNEGLITLGLLISFPSIASSFMTPIISLMDSLSQIMVVKSYINKINEVIEQKELESEFGDKKLQNLDKINLEKASFSYSRFEDNILNDIDLEINKYEKVAIVGPSGSGKSTLLKILSGLYEPNQGRVMINENNIRDFSVESFRNKVCYINQEPTIFNTSILENIVLDKTDIDHEKFNKVIDEMMVGQIIENLPLGVYTNISEGGMNLSGGQKQKISLARALYKTPDILLLDEPTSSLDNISEKVIVDNLKKCNMTILIVSHRLSTITQFDKIIVMDEGNIVGIGTHDELISKCQLYNDMYSTESKENIEKEYVSVI